MGATIHSAASTKSWAIWLAATVVTFGALEAHAVSTRRRPTLSGALRSWLGLDPVKPYRWAGALAFSSFFGWLVLHIVADVGPRLPDRKT